MGERRVIAGEFIKQNLIAVARGFTQVHFHDEASLFGVLSISAVAAHPSEAVGMRILLTEFFIGVCVGRLEGQIVAAYRAEFNG